MLYQSQILIQEVGYNTPDNRSIFHDMTLSFGSEKTAIVGKNGIGKSTLLKLIIGALSATSGAVNVSGTVAYCPQDLSGHAGKAVADLLGVAEKLEALARIQQGSVDTQDFEFVGDDWDIEGHIARQLEQFGLGAVSLERDVQSMSGGERTRLWLAKTFLADTDCIILDEPTNNLDLEARHRLYAAIEQWDRGLIVVSHDRKLLGLMDRIVELTTLGAQVYGGNYDHYAEQKALEQSASERQLSDAEKEIRKTKRAIQATREKRDRRESMGRRERKARGQAKVILDKRKERSEKTQGQLSTREERLMSDAKERLRVAKEQVEITHEIRMTLPKTSVPSSKMVVQIENLCFSYAGQTEPIIKDCNLSIRGPERLALMGPNGSGKTTLVKLIQGEIKPDSGTIKVGVSCVRYLDQHVGVLDPAMSILENYRQLNPNIKEMDAHANLAHFLFRSKDALKCVCDLSGGEKLRAALACVLTSDQPPQLLILDEPTNHLDLESMESLESALRCYQGAMIVITHDEAFVENVGVTRVVDLV